MEYSGAHNLNVRSYEEEAIYFESGDTSTPIILLSCPDNVFNICHVLFAQIYGKHFYFIKLNLQLIKLIKFNTLIVLSYDDVTIKCPPSGWYLSPETRLMCAGIVYKQALFLTSQIRHVLSSLPVAN